MVGSSRSQDLSLNSPANSPRKLQKRMKVNVSLRVKEKRFKKKAKNLNELVQGVKTKKVKKILKKKENN